MKTIIILFSAFILLYPIICYPEDTQNSKLDLSNIFGERGSQIVVIKRILEKFVYPKIKFENVNDNLHFLFYNHKGVLESTCEISVGKKYKIVVTLKEEEHYDVTIYSLSGKTITGLQRSQGTNYCTIADVEGMDNAIKFSSAVNNLLNLK